jgi:hypothetical protein
MNSFIPELVIAALLVVLSALLWNPFWMPMGVMLVVLVLFVLLCGGFVGFIWHERGGDERDVLIRHVAARFAYLSGAVIMGVGIIYEMLSVHSVDKWLLAAFIITVLAKAAGYAWGKVKY